MNWEAIGAIGEVAGAVGVVATLVYLATQVRQNSSQLDSNSEAVRAATELENARLSAEWNQFVAADPELIELLMAAARQEAMTDVQRLRFRFLLAALFYRFEGLYRQRLRGLLPEDSWEAWAHVIRNLMASDEATRWWRSDLHPFSASFRAVVDEILEGASAPPSS